MAGGMEIDNNVPISQFPENLLKYKDVQPLTKGFIDVTKPPYSAVGNGKTDDTKALQAAITDAYNCNLVVFLPANKIFLVSQQLNCVSKRTGSRKFAFQLVGSSNGNTPIIRLKDGSSVDDNILIYFELITNLKKNPPSLYGSTFRGIDIDMGNNPSVNALSMAGAQYCVIEDVKIYGKQFNTGICSLPGSGGGTVNVTVSGGKIGILENQYRPNPTITGITLENQSECGLKILQSRGPIIMTGFKITSPENPSADYRAIYLKNAALSHATNRNDQGNSNLCLTDGTIEVKGNAGKAIYNFAQDVTMSNVFVKAAEIIESGEDNPPTKIVKGINSKWQLITSYVFTASTGKSSAFVNGKDLNDRNAAFEIYDPLVAQQPVFDLISRHIWDKAPHWDDANVLDIVADFGATSEEVDDKDDDWKAIQDAIDQSTTPGNPNFGKTVFIPRGHFHISRPLNLRSGLKMIGAGLFISVIQALKDWNNALGPLMESENSATGSLYLSHFAILGYPNQSFLHIRTANTLMRDVATEKVGVGQGYQATNRSELPYISFTDNAGGKIYNVSTDHIHSKNEISNSHSLGHQLWTVQNTTHPLSFYQISIEHLQNSPQSLFQNVHHVAIYGFKYEFNRELINIINSDDVKIVGGSGNYQIDRDDDRAIIVIENSSNILIQNMDIKSNYKVFDKSVAEMTKYWILNGKDSVSGDYGVLLYISK